MCKCLSDNLIFWALLLYKCYHSLFYKTAFLVDKREKTQIWFTFLIILRNVFKLFFIILFYCWKKTIQRKIKFFTKVNLLAGLHLVFNLESCEDSIIGKICLLRNFFLTNIFRLLFYIVKNCAARCCNFFYQSKIYRLITLTYQN